MFETYIAALRLIQKYSGPEERFRVKMALLSGLFRGICLFAIPFLFSIIIEDITAKNFQTVELFFAVLIVSILLSVCNNYGYRRVEATFTYLAILVRKGLFDEIHSKPLDWHTKQSTGYISSTVERCAMAVRPLFFETTWNYIPNTFILIAFSVYTFILSPWLTLYFLIFLFSIMLASRLLYKKRIQLLKERSVNESLFNKIFFDLLSNIQTLKKLHIKLFANKSLDKEKKGLKKTEYAIGRYNAFQWGFVEISMEVMFFLPFSYYLWQAIQTGEGLSVLVMLMSIRGVVMSFTSQFLNLMLTLSKSQADFHVLNDRLFEDTTFVPHTDYLPKSWDKIHFSKTIYTYTKDENGFVHRVADLEIKRGEHIAVIGASGHGKTTFMNLVTQNLFVDEGTVSLDDTDYKKVSPEFFERNMAYVSQDVELFNMSFEDNITLKKDISKERLQKVLDGCCLTDLVERMGGDLSTFVGEKGIRVSAGEKQRINLARGLLLDRDVLVLDEITANLDPHTADKIWGFVFEEYKDRTIIAISHESKLKEHAHTFIEFHKGEMVKSYSV